MLYPETQFLLQVHTGYRKKAQSTGCLPEQHASGLSVRVALKN